MQASTAIESALNELDNAWMDVQHNVYESGPKRRARDSIEKAIHEVEQLKQFIIRYAETTQDGAGQ